MGNTGTMLAVTEILKSINTRELKMKAANFRNFIVKAVAVSSMLVASSAFASAITNATGLSSPGTTITFSEVALSPGDVITNQFASYGATFSPFATFRPQDGFYATDYIGNFGTPGTANPFLISFGKTVNAAAFDFISNPGTTMFDAMNGATIVESFSASTDVIAGTFYGFENIVFDSIRINSPSNGAMEMDNLQISAVPEPTTVALLGLGLLGFAASRRKSAKSKNT